ncbi:hypothetical protein OSB04_013726 [Centaurea solstitialis]|uniref:C2 domain-containing protein n=1 Tax=Centaurea solstitialis TaxID=347529 RepID=A0AA38WFR9_9ASTR|nr:hypothetical protein OSB04_013726 [Centaurea solstitialis]
MAAVRKLIVEVIDARNLVPKDGHGTSSPYVILDFYGQRRKTRVVARDLNPVWNETLEFNVGKPSDVFGDMLEVDVNHDRNLGPTTRNNFLGRVRLNSRQFVKKGEEALIYYPLEKKHLFSWIQGEIGLKIYFSDEVPAPAPAPPSPPPPEVVEGKPKSPEEASDEKPESTEATKSPEKEKVNEVPVPEVAPPADDSGNDGGVSDDGGFDLVQPGTPVTEGRFDYGRLKTSRSMPEINIGGSIPIGPQPIPRVSSVSSFTTDVSDRFPIERSSFDLVEKMHYLFVRVVKARSLPTPGNPVTKIVVSGLQVVSKPARKGMYFEWDQTFAFRRGEHDSTAILEVSVWDPLVSSSMSDVAGHNFLGGICFDATEIPLRDPPDSPLAPQWYRLEGGGAHKGDLMLATWVGTQADESFPEAWKTDTAGNPGSRSKIYQSPKLWYLRATIIEAQDVPLSSSFQIKAQFGFQAQKTKSIVTRNGSSSWNEDLMFVVAEPFSDQPLLLFLVEQRGPKEPTVVGVASVPLASIERRVDDRVVVSKWLTFEDPNEEKRVYRGRVQLKVFFDGGYHVMDEAAHVCSDYRPTAKQLWKPPIGTVELGIVGCKNLLPMKSINGKGSTDAYAVAKYGSKWVRTRAISDNLEPKWNEQYTWRVYDPSTVLTIGVFDSWEAFENSDGGKESTRLDFRLGKVRIRISNLEMGRVYKNTYPLMLLNGAGLKKMGELELAVRFVRMAPRLDFLNVYTQPLLPIMHHVKPIGVVQQEVLRTIAVKVIAAHLARSEPPLRREVVTYMLDADSHAFSMRKVRANWLRIINVLSGVIDMVKWLDETRSWKNPTATVLVHVLLMMLVWFPDLIIPTLAFYVFVVGVWNYRFRSRSAPPHFDPKLSLAETIDGNELDEEFDAMPCTRPNETVRARYDKLRMLGARVQSVLGDIATQGERVQALVTWRDPHATGIFVGLCLVVAIILYLVPSKMVAMTFGKAYSHHLIIMGLKNMGKLWVFLMIIIWCWASMAEAEYTPYKDPKRSLGVRINDLMKRMTLEEKIGQMTQIERSVASDEVMKKYLIVEEEVFHLKRQLLKDGDMVNDFQKGSLSTRLGIPMIYGIDAVHGNNNVYKATIFPHNVGLGVTRDPVLVKKIGAATALEVRATGIQYAFAPCIAVCRDPRWGRCYESYSEDPKIVRLMTEIIPGLQGEIPYGSKKGAPFVQGQQKVAACAKHYLGDGGTHLGTNEGNTVTDSKKLFSIHMPAYNDSIIKGVATVMTSYSSWNGVKMHANRHLVTDYLKNKLNFKGFVISDWEGIDRITTPAHANYTYSILAGINAGIDMFMIPLNYTEFIDGLTDLVKNKFISMSRVDDAVERILRVKFTMGLFETPLADYSMAKYLGCQEHRDLAREAVRKTLVLLKNGKDSMQPLLPLPKKTSKILVAGSHANNIGYQCGGWTIEWQGLSGNVTDGMDIEITESTTILSAVKSTVDPSTKVVYNENPNNDFLKSNTFDYAIVVVGEPPYAETFGDSSNLTIPEPGLNTIKNVCSSVKCVVVLITGRPVVVQPFVDTIDALVAAWLPGTEGQGVTDVLFGDYGFTGKLARTWFKSVDQLPMNVGDPHYDPLYPFGFGLTTTPTRTV